MALISSLFGSPTNSIFEGQLPCSSLVKPQLWRMPALTGRRLRKPTCSKLTSPGLKKEEVKVEIEDDRVLPISGERNAEKEDKNDTWHHLKRSNGKFLRRFRLPENATIDRVKASMKNGVLTVTVPKEDVKKPDVKAIEISA